MGERREGMGLPISPGGQNVHVQTWRLSGKCFWCLNYYVGLCIKYWSGFRTVSPVALMCVTTVVYLLLGCFE